MSIARSIRDDLHKLTKLFNILTSQELSKLGITRPQALVIREVLEQPKTIGQISKSVDLSNSTVSGIVDRLEKNGYVERIRDENDRRVIWIGKTEKVKDLGEQLTVTQEQYYQDNIASLSPEELDAFQKTIRIIITNLESKIVK